MFTAGRILHKANLRNVNSPNRHHPHHHYKHHYHPQHHHHKHQNSPSSSNLNSPYDSHHHRHHSPNISLAPLPSEMNQSIVDKNPHLHTSSSSFQMVQNKLLMQQQQQIQEETSKVMSSKLSRFYVPFIWQAMVACLVGVAIITIGVCLCILGYEAESEIEGLYEGDNLRNIPKNELSEKYALYKFSSKKQNYKKDLNLSVIENKFENVTTQNFTFLHKKSDTNNNKIPQSTRYLIYVGPVIMSFGSFAIVFACVIVCETRDRVLDLLEKRTKQLEGMVVQDMKEKNVLSKEVKIRVPNQNEKQENIHVNALEEKSTCKAHKNSDNQKDFSRHFEKKNEENSENNIIEVGDEINENAGGKEIIRKEYKRDKNNSPSAEDSSSRPPCSFSSSSPTVPFSSKCFNSNSFYKKSEQKIDFENDLKIVPNPFESFKWLSMNSCKLPQQDFGIEISNDFEKESMIENSKYTKNPIQTQVLLEQQQRYKQPQKDKLSPINISANRLKERRSSFQILYKMKIDILTNSLITNQLKRAIQAKNKEIKKTKTTNIQIN